MSCAFKKFRKPTFNSLVWLMLFAVINLNSGCSYQYKIVERPITPKNIGKIINPNLFLILHYHNETYHLINPEILSKQESIVGIIEYLPENRKIYRVSQSGVKNTYSKSSGFMMPYKEVHIYINEPIIDNVTHITIPFDQILKLDHYKGANSGKTTAGFVGVAIGAGLVFVAVFISRF